MDTVAGSRPDRAAAGPSSSDPYEASVALSKLQRARAGARPLRLACLDVDSTLTGDGEAANRVRACLEDAGYVVVFDTSRTEEMLLSEHSYTRSREAGGLDRLLPHLGHADGRRVYVPPEQCEPRGLLDGDIIAGSTGTRILLRQRDGVYLPDHAYEKDHGMSSGVWRKTVLGLVEDTLQQVDGAELAPIDREESYRAGLSDVAPPDFRIQVDAVDLDAKNRFLTAFRSTCEAMAGEALTSVPPLRVTDDSKPENNAYKLFITPRTGTKPRAAERIVRMLCRHLSLDRRDLTLLFAGDSFPDLAMGLLGGLGTRANFLLVGGSRLPAGLLEEDRPDFAGEPLRAVRARLRPEGQRGYYRFQVPGGGGSRTLIVGDEAFPGTEAVKTVEAFLDETQTPAQR